MIPYPVKYVTKKQIERARAHPAFLEQYPSAGPNCNVTGMRNKYWGKNAALLKHGRYVYNVPLYVYNMF